MGEEVKEVLEDVKRHLDYVNATNQSSIRDNEIKVMYEEINRLKEVLNTVRKYLELSESRKRLSQKYVNIGIERYNKILDLLEKEK